MNILLIGIGGALGSIGRYLINEFFIRYIPAEYPLLAKDFSTPSIFSLKTLISIIYLEKLAP